MRFPRSVMILLFAGVCCAPAAFAQSFPVKPLRIITGGAGGANDLITRASAQGITNNLGQSAVVINRGGILSITEVMKAAPDGYTLLAAGANQFWLAPFLRDNVPYDPVKDFTPVILTATSPNMVVVSSSVQATSIRELIALAKAKPGVLNYGIANYGGSPHLAGELFKAMSQTNIVTVPYKETARAMIGLIAGESHLMFPTVSTGMPGVKGGKLRALAVTSLRPSPMAPGLPSLSESGLPGYESNVDYAVFAPAKTPAGIIETVNRAIARHLQTPEVREKLFAAGLEVVAGTVQELAATMTSERERMGKVIRDAGIRSE